MPSNHFEAQRKRGQLMLKRSGFITLMSINKLPEIRDYWSTNDYLHYSPIADRITRDRFEQITQVFHFADNDTLPERGEEGFSRLQKVDTIISALKQNFQAAYYPHCRSHDPVQRLVH